ncbi:unnamed protein product, partial [Medioppia subpectinata]
MDVNTTSGVVRGLKLQVLNKTVNQFLNIPFAEPPVGSLRFAPPVPLKQPLKDVIDATKQGNSCLQPNPTTTPQSEDCLVLNIWTPNAGNNNTNKSQLKPIMFYIYGGALVNGTIFLLPGYNGSILATHDVLVVSTNYRLGQFGFLYGDREDAPGNVGFYDQLLGLKWVRENVHKFGGDRDQITIFGESAGSVSVSAQIISPLSKGLFKRAIMESGAHMYNKDRDAISKPEAIANGKHIAKQLKCNETEDWMQCLRRADARDILKFTPTIAFPVEGTEFLPISAQKALKTKQLNTDIDLMAGLTRDEGALLTQYVLNHSHIESVADFRAYLSETDQIYHSINTTKVTDFYLHGVNISNPLAIKQAFNRFFGDLMMNCPTYLFSEHFAQISPQNDRNVYFYRWDYQSDWFAKRMNCDPVTMGICHGADVPFVWGLDYQAPMNVSMVEKQFTDDVMRMWTNFAKTGIPDPNWPHMWSQN